MRRRRRGCISFLVAGISEELVNVDLAVLLAEFFGDAVSSFLNSTGGLRIDRGTINDPLHHSVKIGKYLGVGADWFGLGGAHRFIVLCTQKWSIAIAAKV